MGWYILQGIAFALGALSSLLWYEPGGNVTAKQAAMLTLALGIVAAFGATMLASAFLVKRVDRRNASPGPERITHDGRALAQHEGAQRIQGLRLLFWRARQ